MITSNVIIDYLKLKFKDDYRFSGDGIEFIANSPFEEDHSKHFTINTETGLWQDFKSSTSGNFIQLYAKLEGLTYKQALVKINIKSLFSDNPNKDDQYKKYKLNFDCEEDTLNEKFIPLGVSSKLTKETEEAWLWLAGRKLFDIKNQPENDFYLCLKEDSIYNNRVIIPFVFKDKMVYFQARALNKAQHPKYLNPPTMHGLDKSCVLYPYDSTANQLVVCEGPLDAKSMKLQGINATCTLGSSPSPYQIKTIFEFPGRIIIAYHKDKAGFRGTSKFINAAKRLSLTDRVFTILPPGTDDEDWNDAHIKKINIPEFINENMMEIGWGTEATNALEDL